MFRDGYKSGRLFIPGFLYRLFTFSIAAVWLINGLYCKILNQVPRHEEIVARILGPTYSRSIIVAIGIAEVLMGIWIISRIKPTWSAWLQIGLVAVMNLLEFFLARDLLLWGPWNLLFSLLFILIVYFQSFILQEEKNQA